MVKVEVKGAGELSLGLGKIIKALTTEQRESLLEKIGMRVIKEAVYKHFEDKTAPDGTKWPPVSPEYAKRKLEGKVFGRKSKRSAINSPAEILMLTQALYNSIHYEVEKYSVKIIAGDASDAEKYAAAHNFGYPEQNIPKRQFLGIGKLEEKAAREVTESFVNKVISGNLNNIVRNITKGF